MKTLLNTSKMNKQLLTLIVAVLLLPLSSFAQDIFEKYSDNPSVTYVNIKPKMFQMLAKMDVSTDDPEAQAYMEMVNSITSFKTIVTDDKSISADVVGWVTKKSSGLEELMVVKDNGMEVKFFVKEGKDADHVKELLVFVNGLSAVTKDADVNINGKKREFETVVVSLTGDIDLNQISKLTEKMNIPAGDKLDKKQ
ncbi:MAG: DUF4252 domain-containing protein [Flavobacteriaceae bacterium]|nr:DUF4252 domain-containing protein [Mangrovimonas sp.]HRV54359.1 DUF4252 domain-containing protein [Mangrovimonas sp.]